jgi:integrase
MSLITRKKAGREAWYIRGTINGRRIEESTDTTDLALAEQYRVKRERELHLEGIYGTAAVRTFPQAVVHYLEHDGSKRFMGPLVVHFSTSLLSAIGQGEIDACAKKLYPNASGSTRNRQVYGPMVAVLNHAARLQWCSRPAIRRPKAPPVVERWLTKIEANRLLEAASPHMRRLILFLIYTGARCGEALWLDWKNVDLDRKVVLFTNTKNGTSRGVPLHKRVVDELRKTNRREGSVFLTDDGKEYTHPKEGQNADTSAGSRIKTAFKAACRRAGILNFRPHDCRHTWATWHYIANRDLGALMRLGGWKTMAMVMRYAHVNVDELASSIDRL